jgi:hypothetical protein
MIPITSLELRTAIQTLPRERDRIVAAEYLLVKTPLSAIGPLLGRSRSWAGKVWPDVRRQLRDRL